MSRDRWPPYSICTNCTGCHCMIRLNFALVYIFTKPVLDKKLPCDNTHSENYVLTDSVEMKSRHYLEREGSSIACRAAGFGILLASTNVGVIVGPLIGSQLSVFAAACSGCVIMITCNIYIWAFVPESLSWAAKQKVPRFLFPLPLHTRPTTGFPVWVCFCGDLAA